MELVYEKIKMSDGIFWNFAKGSRLRYAYHRDKVDGKYVAYDAPMETGHLYDQYEEVGRYGNINAAKAALQKREDTNAAWAPFLDVAAEMQAEGQEAAQ